MDCLAAAPLGIFVLVLKCKGVAETVAHEGDETEAPDSNDEGNTFHDHRENESDDEHDASECLPAFSSGEEGIPAMPTIVHPASDTQREKTPTLQFPFNSAVSRPASKQGMYSNPKAQSAARADVEALPTKRARA